MNANLIFQHFVGCEVFSEEEHELLIECAKKVLAHHKRNLQNGSSVSDHLIENMNMLERVIENHQLHLTYSNSNLVAGD